MKVVRTNAALIEDERTVNKKIKHMQMESIIILTTQHSLMNKKQTTWFLLEKPMIFFKVWVNFFNLTRYLKENFI